MGSWEALAEHEPSCTPASVWWVPVQAGSWGGPLLPLNPRSSRSPRRRFFPEPEGRRTPGQRRASWLSPPPRGGLSSWWAWCSTSPASTTRCSTGPGTRRPTSATSTAGPSPSAAISFLLTEVKPLPGAGWGRGCQEEEIPAWAPPLTPPSRPLFPCPPPPRPMLPSLPAPSSPPCAHPPPRPHPLSLLPTPSLPLWPRPRPCAPAPSGPPPQSAGVMSVHLFLMKRYTAEDLYQPSPRLLPPASEQLLRDYSLASSCTRTPGPGRSPLGPPATPPCR